MSSAIERFTAALRSDPRFGTAIADQIAAAHAAVDIEADGNPHALQLYEGLEWIIRHERRSVDEKLEQIFRLLDLRGHNLIQMKAFTGWPE